MASPGSLASIDAHTLLESLCNCGFMVLVSMLSEQFNLWVFQEKAAETSQESQ